MPSSVICTKLYYCNILYIRIYICICIYIFICIYIYIYIYISDSQIVHHNPCFNLYTSFDNQGSEINKNDIFLRFDILSFTKTFFLCVCGSLQQHISKTMMKIQMVFYFSTIWGTQYKKDQKYPKMSKEEEGPTHSLLQ